MNTRRSVLFATITFVAVGAFAYLLPTFAQQGQEDARSLKGKPAPDFTLKTLDDKEVKLSEQKGNVVVLDFWATWCPPCRKALPHLQEISQDQELAKQGLKVYAVNARETDEKVQAFMKENNYSFAVPMDRQGETMKAYMVRGIPTTVIVGRDGKVRDVFVGFGGEQSAKQMHEAIEAALKESKPAA